MAILKIARAGHPVLLETAQPVTDTQAPDIQLLLADMVETLKDAGGVGLAAPQVYRPLRLFIWHLPATRAENGVAVPLSVVFNPEITPRSEVRELGWEGCLSIPGLRAAVPRHRDIRLTGLDANGAPFSAHLSGWAARIVQHETDHLDGILYPMRMSDFRYFGFTEETERYNQPLPEIV